MNNYSIYKVMTDNGDKVMMAPLKIITEIFQLHDAAVQRVLSNGNEATFLYPNSQKWPMRCSFITVSFVSDHWVV